MSVATPTRRLDAAVATAIVVNVIWAGNLVTVKWAIGAWEPLVYACLRFVIGGALFGLWVLLRERSLRVPRRDVPLIVACALIGVVINQFAFMQATSHTTAATIGLVMASVPAFAVLFSTALGRERVGWGHWLGIGLAVVGVALILVGGGGRIDLTSVEGDLWALLTAATWAGYSVLVRPLLAHHSASRISALVLLVGGPLLIPVAWTGFADQDLALLGAGPIAALAYSVVASLLLTNVLWFWAVHRAGASKITAVMPVQPLAGVILAVVLLGESVAPLQLVGGAIVIAGVIATQIRQPELLEPRGA